ncbi:MAG: MarC family protein [Alphaproteobacteria bacterium]|nr:MarC family protein [Alphaproteobacteria bacterium]
MNAFANALLLTYATLFPIINPIGNAPILLSLTRGRSREERNTLARRVAVNSFFLLLGSLLVGSHVLEFFGISLPVVRIGGGLVVTAFGWRLLNSGVSADSDATAAGPKPKPLDTFYPFTMPLTVGPGSISVAIALGSQRPVIVDLPHLALLAGAALVGLVAISATIYLCYRFAEATVARLGAGGTNVVVRLSAFILVCIGIQIIYTGWTGLMALPR